jgi:hypothetical protein
MWIGIFICLLSINIHSAWGFAEEPLYFRDPFTGVAGIEQVSSVHTELARALALAAGFNDADAAIMSIYNQLTDSMRFSSTNGMVYYTNCSGVYPPIPNPDDPAICPSGKGEGALIFPLYPSQTTYGQPCVLARPGFFGPFFHFPRTDNGELENARKWAWGETRVLKGYAAFSWGTKGAEAIEGVCHYQMPMNIETGLEPGSLEAFGTYLHMLADSIHHRLCIADILALSATVPGLFGWPTLDPNREPKSCYYDWNNPSNYDENGVEFGSGNGTDRSDDASIAVYEELVRRSMAREGKYCPIDWNAPLIAMVGSPTLREACFNFIHNWAYEKETGNKGEYASLRRDYAHQMMDAIRAQRTLTHRPTLAGIAPARSQATGLGTNVTVTVKGRNMAPDAIVRWNGEALDATYVNPRKMTVIVPAAKIGSEGSAVITVYNPQGCGESAGKTFVYSYPSPALSRLNPGTAASGGPAFTLNLTGRNFIPLSKVRWTMGRVVTELPVTYVSPIQLQVQVTETMVTGKGAARVQVETAGDRILKSARLTFRIN